MCSLSSANFAENPSKLSKGLDGLLDVHFFVVYPKCPLAVGRVADDAACKPIFGAKGCRSDRNYSDMFYHLSNR